MTHPASPPVAPPVALPVALHRAARVRDIERAAIEADGLEGAALMERAGAAAFLALRERWPAARALAVLCGTGNNGGDGFVIARLAAGAGLAVRVALVGEAESIGGDAAVAFARMRAAGVRAEPLADALATHALAGADVVVDALLGTGLAREVGGGYAAAVAAQRAAGAPCLALDVPTGLHADTGRVLGTAVRADLTVTFVALKPGLFTGAAREHCGEVRFAALGVSAALRARFAPDAERLDLEGLRGALGPRARGAHKGRFGHVLVVGGDRGFAGAARLAAESAARVGAGLVSVATRPEHVAAIVGPRPELMCHGVEDAAGLAALAAHATVIAVGPGLGRGAWGRALLDAALASDRPLVVDADALNLIAESPPAGRGPAARVHTPHPGEAARLLGTSAREVEADRFAALAALVARYGGVWILKGAGTLVGGGEGPPAACAGGNPGMAAGGMGDTLTGVVAGLAAQGLAPRDAARLGVCLHAAAGDAAAAAGGERGTLAGDLLPHLRRLASSA